MNYALKMDKESSIDTPIFDLDSLCSTIAERAKEYDTSGQFVQANYDDLKEHKFFSIAVPTELGGGGISYSELADTIKTLAGACGSTALAYAMHSHPLMLNVYKYKNMSDVKAKSTLEKIAANELIIAGTGANDWLQSNGLAEPVEGGYRINAHKRFVSGGPGANVFVTSAVYLGENGEEVLHFSIPFNTRGIQIQQNWDSLGMRGTGSNDVTLTDVFVPEGAIVARRPVGEWHPMWDMIIPIAIPLIVSCYLGLAEKAAELAIKNCTGKLDRFDEIGRLNNHLTAAQLAREAMVAQCDQLNFTPNIRNSETILRYKTLATQSIHATVNCAADIIGGASFFRGSAIERILRDVRALHFHPLPESKQAHMSGRVSLGLSPF